MTVVYICRVFMKCDALCIAHAPKHARKRSHLRAGGSRARKVAECEREKERRRERECDRWRARAEKLYSGADIFVNVYIHIYTCICICICICIYIYIYVYILEPHLQTMRVKIFEIQEACVAAPTHTYMHTHTHIHTHVPTYIHIYTPSEPASYQSRHLRYWRLV